MKKLIRFSLVALAAGMLLIVCTGVALAASVATSMATDGVVMVRVHEKHPGGVDFSVPIPAAFVGAGLHLAHGFAGAELAEARAQLEPLHGALDELLAHMAATGDATFVQVDDRQDHVVISKRGSSLVVDVDSSDAKVKITVPLGLVRQVVDSLAS